MKVRSLFYLLALVLLSSNILNAQEQSRIATYDYNSVIKSSVYKNIYLLDMKPEVIKSIKNLNQQIDNTLQKFYTEDNLTVLQDLQKQLKTYEDKKRIITRVIHSKRYKNNKQELLNEFIQEYYSQEYDVIIPRKFLYDNYGKVIVNSQKVDITEQIIKDIAHKVEDIY